MDYDINDARCHASGKIDPHPTYLASIILAIFVSVYVRVYARVFGYLFVLLVLDRQLLAPSNRWEFDQLGRLSTPHQEGSH